MDDLARAAQFYMNGGCHHVAVALHRAHGWPMIAVAEDTGDGDFCDADGDDLPCILHVYAFDGTHLHDARGSIAEDRLWQDIDELGYAHDLDSCYEVELDSEDELATYLEDNGGPLLGYSEADIEEATTFLRMRARPLAA